MANKALETARKAGQIALAKRGFDVKVLTDVGAAQNVPVNSGDAGNPIVIAMSI